MSVTAAGKTSGPTMPRPQLYSPENLQQLMNSSRESLQQPIDSNCFGIYLKLVFSSSQQVTFKMKMQTWFQRASTNSLWWERYCPYLLYLSNPFLVTGYIALLFYALIWEAGIIVNLPTKIIGFYNICLWNEEAEKLDCLLFKDLEKMGINNVALVLSRICVYSTLVLCLYVATTILQALCLKDKDGWKLACTLLAVGALSLPAGLSLFLFQTERWVQISELGGGFLALAGAHPLLLLHMIIIGMYLAQRKDALPPGQFFPVVSIP